MVYVGQPSELLADNQLSIGIGHITGFVETLNFP
jgi:hypothetical protein